MSEEQTVYVSTAALESSGGAPPRWHPVETCHNVQAMDDVTELPRSEAEKKCSRQATCCSTIAALEDLDD